MMQQLGIDPSQLGMGQQGMQQQPPQQGMWYEKTIK
jgi:hypothetical protein